MTKELWQEEAKKIGGESLVQVIEEIRDGQTLILERMDKMDERHEIVDDTIKALNSAFPGNDVAGHCRYHSVQIEMLVERRALIAAIKEKTISGLVWLLVLWVGATLARSLFPWLIK